jgi:hypothetical protein
VPRKSSPSWMLHERAADLDPAVLGRERGTEQDTRVGAHAHVAAQERGGRDIGRRCDDG